MADNTLIAWAHSTFNAWIGCVRVSKGCENCYAEILVTGRMGRPGLWGPEKTADRSRTSAANWAKPARWNRTAQTLGTSYRVFLGSLMDFFEKHAQLDAPRRDAWQLIRETPFLQYLIVTKRPENIEAMLPTDWGAHGYPNVWLITSIEDMRVKERADILRTIPAVVRGISYEPAIGPLDDINLSGIDWVIYGGESGSKRRPEDKAWARVMRDRGVAEGFAFFHKQSAAPRTEMGIELDGRIERHYQRPRSLDWPVVVKASNYHLISQAVHDAYADRVAADLAGAHARPLDIRATARAELPLFGGES